MEEKKVIYFDGVCGLCNGFVDFMLAVDRKKLFLFAPLQSDYAKANLSPQHIADLTSVVYARNGNTFTKSEAILEIMGDLSGGWRLLKAGRILPRSFRDRAYDLVAQNRYQLFGKKETCRLPTPEERQRFLS